jgi:hypothetical protein
VKNSEHIKGRVDETMWRQVVGLQCFGHSLFHCHHHALPEFLFFLRFGCLRTGFFLIFGTPPLLQVAVPPTEDGEVGPSA